ncbi:MULTISPECIES: PAAR domain-containing protein [unclassified Psychrobacter]|jgi:uncharacterized Zn-binding protein involved in type VI secretion|uniref:PAAR domain-containing protein n=7 Tax=Gammaproteobacteria TaxID=1236 RepID=UPI00041B78A1|nr:MULTISPECIES: PAAR domain-containing protein [unclassified Psychrobacter]
MAAYITVGATTTHGGEVISGSPHSTHNGIPISRKGDKVICKKCKKLTTILTGDSSFIVDGAPIARAGDVTSCGAKLIANQQSFCESDFEVMGVEQPAPMQFPKSDPEAVFASFAAPKDNQPSESYNNDLDILFVNFTPFDNEDNAAEGSLVAGNTYAGEPNEGGGGSDRPIYIPGTAGTPEELRYQAELESIYINVGGDEAKFRQGVKEIAARDMLAFDILTIPAGLALKSAQIGVKAGQYVIKSRVNKPKISASNSSLKLPSNSTLKVPNGVINKFPESFKSPIPNRKGGEGYRWFDGANKGNSVRIDKGNPSNSQIRQQVDHVIINNNGRIIGRNGEPIKGTIKDNWDQAHIPLKEYEQWNKWNSPK